jgi:hypothetical protein
VPDQRMTTVGVSEGSSIDDQLIRRTLAIRSSHTGNGYRTAAQRTVAPVDRQRLVNGVAWWRGNR